MGRLKIVADSEIPFLKDVFEPFAEVIYCKGKDIDSDTVMTADALVVRTSTKCDAALLDGSSVKIISTASIGTDHIDIAWCRQHGIKVCVASGAKSGAVMDYVFSALYGMAARKSIDLTGKTFGVVGLGNVGQRVAQMAEKLGFKVLRNDPYKEANSAEEYVSLEELLRSSHIVSLHLPLNISTRNMASTHFFSLMQAGAFFINASWGELVDEKALKEAIPRLGPVVIDAWNNEPNIDRELLEMVDIATPHIAGYSLQGKIKGTSLAVRAVAEFFDFEPLKDYYPTNDDPQMIPMKLSIEGKTQGEIASLFQYNYPIFTDDFMLRMFPDDFALRRSEYSLRREFYI